MSPREVHLARANRWSMSDRQAFLVAGLLVLGAFLIFYGFGLSNVAVIGLGAAMAVLGPALSVMARIRGNREYVYGTGHVHEVSPLPAVGTFGRCELQLVVNARGVNGVPVRVRDAAVPTSKWPDVGATLPVMVAVDNPRRVQILWNDVLTHRQATSSDQELSRFGERPADGDPDGLTDTDPYDYGFYPPESTDRELEYSPTRTDRSAARAPQASPSPPPNQRSGPRPSPRPSPRPRPRPDDLTPRSSPSDGSPPEPLPTRIPAPRPFMADLETPAVPVAAPSGGQTLEFTLREQEVEPPALTEGAVAQFLPAGPGTSTGGISGVSVTLIVADLQRSRRFYRDKVGMDEVDSNAQTAVLAFGDAGVVLRQVSDMAPVDRRVVQVNLEVTDVRLWYERLRAHGVEFVHQPQVVPHGEHLDLCSAMFRDPDGHAVTLMRWEIRR